jgi:hypothetical protein
VLQKHKLIVIYAIILYGCTCSNHMFKGEGIDEIPMSPCAKCNAKPFYINGNFINENS